MNTQQILDNMTFKGQIKKVRSEHKCKECKSRLICEDGKWYHIGTRTICSLLAKYDENVGKHFEVKTSFGRENAWYIKVQ